MTDLDTSRTRPLAARLADLLEEARRRTLALCDVTPELARAQIDPLMSPLVWDLAHIGNYEDLWLVRSRGASATGPDQLDDLYNAFEHPRWTRPSLPMLSLAEARAYDADVRRRALELLASADLGPDAEPLFADGFVYGMVIQHEHQHDETLLATHQLRGERATTPPGARPTAPPGEGAGHVVVLDDVLIDGGEVEIGSRHPWAYDNERPVHRVVLAPFRLDRHPVTNAAYCEFIDAGGYGDPRWWSAEGWAWRIEHDATAPQFWRRTGSDGWEVLRYGRWRPVHPDEPVQHVCWFEADAFARWAGRRLPTEAEWETAATWHPDEGKRSWPWGDADPTPEHANLGQRVAGPQPVGSHPVGVNPWGVHGLIGDVWEWTASSFGPHPGFRAFPYREYSEVFFGDAYRVLRGGSWATHPVAVRGTFRNWDYPIRRQIFAGFRTAADEAGTVEVAGGAATSPRADR